MSFFGFEERAIATLILWWADGEGSTGWLSRLEDELNKRGYITRDESGGRVEAVPQARVRLARAEHRGIVASIFMGEDGAPVVQIDTPAEGDEHETMRVYLNDARAVRWVEA